MEKKKVSGRQTDMKARKYQSFKIKKTVSNVLILPCLNFSIVCEVPKETEVQGSKAVFTNFT